MKYHVLSRICTKITQFTLKGLFGYFMQVISLPEVENIRIDA